MVSAGEDGALFVVPLESTSALQPLVEARASASYRAVRWASQQTFVSAGTTGVCSAELALSPLNVCLLHLQITDHTSSPERLSVPDPECRVRLAMTGDDEFLCKVCTQIDWLKKSEMLIFDR